MILIPVFLLGFAPILLLIALGVWTSKGRTPLNFVDARGMRDPVAFNKRAGQRLLLLPAAALALGLFGIERPELSVLCLIGFALAILATVVWVLVGAD